MKFAIANMFMCRVLPDDIISDFSKNKEICSEFIDDYISFFDWIVFREGHDIEPKEFMRIMDIEKLIINDWVTRFNKIMNKKFIGFINSVFNDKKSITISDFSYILKLDIHKTHFENKTQIWYVGKPDVLNTKTYIDYESAKSFLDKEVFDKIKGYQEIIECKDGTKHKAIDTMIVCNIFNIGI